MAQTKKRQQQQLKSVFPRKCTMLNLNQNIKSGLDNPKKKGFAFCQIMPASS